MQLPLTLELRPSRRLAALMVVAHGSALAVAVMLVAQDMFWAAVLLPAVLASLGWQFFRLFGAHRLVRLTLYQDGVVEFLCHDGETGSTRVDPQSTVLPWTTVLLLRNTTRRRLALVLLPDALADQDFRRLRLWLRWVATAGR